MRYTEKDDTVAKTTQQRYGGAGTHGRRITDDDLPLGSVTKGADDRSRSQRLADRSRATAEVGGVGLLGSSLLSGSARQAQGISRDTRASIASTKHWPLKAKAQMRGLDAAHDVLTRPRGSALIASGALLAGAGATSAAARAKVRHDEKVGKAARHYDPEHSRQRRIGAAEAGLVGAGGIATQEGARRIYVDSRNMRQGVKVRARGMGDIPLGEKVSGAFRVRKVPALLAAGGGAAIAGASVLHRHASSRRGAAYR